LRAALDDLWLKDVIVGLMSLTRRTLVDRLTESVVGQWSSGVKQPQGLVPPEQVGI
jgi:hypothetical protein